MATDTSNGDTLKTLGDKGEVPKSRIATATQAKNIYDKMVRADQWRSKKRALVKGLVDGNPPYSQQKLKDAGRDYQCNVNWRIAESYFDNARGAFYDVFSETPTYAMISLNGSTPDDNAKASRVVTEHFDWLLKNEAACSYDDKIVSQNDLDYHMQISQGEMVLYGCGPLMFEDDFDWRPKSVLAGQLKVPDRAKSNTNEWEIADVEVEYHADKLYEKISDSESATAVGWNVEEVRKAIIKSHPESQKGGIYKDWEWHQQQLKDGSFMYGDTASVIRTVHVFFKEFGKNGKPGKITHQIILADYGGEGTAGFLYEKKERFDNWNQCIHPMYYDHGGGGMHHSVTGMGVKMYSAIEYQNRLWCNLADKAFTPKIMFKPSSAGSNQEFGLQQFGEYALLNDGFDMVQTPIHGVMEEGTVFNREVTNLISSNLSAYRPNQDSKSGNPRTAREVTIEAQKEASLQKTQLSRYYQQLDGLYSEMYRRAIDQKLTKIMHGGDRAEEFRSRCERDGVPVEMLKKVESVRATRVTGQGSAFLRQQSLTKLMGMVMMFPEGGRDNIIQDMIAAEAGQSSVSRYYPQAPDKQKPNDQNAMATLQVAAMKEGVPAIVTDTQNPVIFAQTFLQASSQAVQTLEQGANPQEVVQFIELAGQAIAAHLQRLQSDPTRKAVFKVLNTQYQQLAKIHDQLVEKIQSEQEEMQRQQQDLQERSQRQDGELELKSRKEQFNAALKQKKQEAGISMAATKLSADISMKDALVASEIHRNNAKAKSESKNRD